MRCLVAYFRRQYGPPSWAIALGEVQHVILLQNEAILAKLEQRECKLTPAQIKLIDDTFDAATGIVRNIDASEKT